MGLFEKFDRWMMEEAEKAEAEERAKAKEEYKPFQHRRPEYSFNEDEKLENTAPHLVGSIYEARNNTREIKDYMAELSSKYDELQEHYTKLEAMLQELNEQKANLVEHDKNRGYGINPSLYFYTTF